MTRLLDRVSVYEDEKHLNLIGYGTYLGSYAIDIKPGVVHPRILLDSGKEILGFQCYFIENQNAPPSPTLNVTLGRKTEIFLPISTSEMRLEKSDHVFEKGEMLTIQHLETKLWPHRLYVAAAVTVLGTLSYLIVTQMGLPLHFPIEPDPRHYE